MIPPILHYFIILLKALLGLGLVITSFIFFTIVSYDALAYNKDATNYTCLFILLTFFIGAKILERP